MCVVVLKLNYEVLSSKKNISDFSSSISRDLFHVSFRASSSGHFIEMSLRFWMTIIS